MRGAGGSLCRQEPFCFSPGEVERLHCNLTCLARYLNFVIASRGPPMSKPKEPRHIRDRKRQLNIKPEAPKKTPLWKLPLEGFGIISALFGILAAILTFLPKLSVDASGSLRSADPMGTVFYLSNDGLLPIHDVTVGCDLNDVGNAQGGVRNLMITLPDSFALILSPGHKMTLPLCTRSRTERHSTRC